MKDDPCIAVIGGGLSGLVCGQVRARRSLRRAAAARRTDMRSVPADERSCVHTCSPTATCSYTSRGRRRNPCQPGQPQALARKGVRCVVFDTGEHSAGGRLATRAAAGSFRKEWVPPALQGAGLAFDHAAQFFTATDPRCAQARVQLGAQAPCMPCWA